MHGTTLAALKVFSNDSFPLLKPGDKPSFPITIKMNAVFQLISYNK
ncbi:hypothetical protein ACFSUM_11770 [Virgibacillus siamensis]